MIQGDEENDDVGESSRSSKANVQRGGSSAETAIAGPSKPKFRPFGDISVGEAILAVPFGIAIGVGGLLKRRKCFDGMGDEKIIEEKESRWTDEEITKWESQYLRSTREPNGLHRSLKSLSIRLRQLTVCDEDIAFTGELAVRKISNRLDSCYIFEFSG